MACDSDVNKFPSMSYGAHCFIGILSHSTSMYIYNMICIFCIPIKQGRDYTRVDLFIADEIISKGLSINDLCRMATAVFVKMLNYIVKRRDNAFLALMLKY